MQKGVVSTFQSALILDTYIVFNRVEVIEIQIITLNLYAF